MKFLLTLTLLLIPVALQAQVPPTLVKGLEPNKEYILSVSANGTVTLSSPIQTVSPGGVVTPPTDPVPNPGNPTDFSKQVQVMTKAVLDNGGSPTTAAALSSVYSLVAADVGKPGGIPEAQAFGAIKLATDTVLNNVADKAKWASWRTDLGTSLETLRQLGVLKIPSAFTEVSQGIDLALGKTIYPTAILSTPQNQMAAQAKLFENIDIQKLIDLIKLILEIFKAFKTP